MNNVYMLLSLETVFGLEVAGSDGEPHQAPEPVLASGSHGISGMAPDLGAHPSSGLLPDVPGCSSYSLKPRHR